MNQNFNLAVKAQTAHGSTSALLAGHLAKARTLANASNTNLHVPLLLLQGSQFRPPLS